MQTKMLDILRKVTIPFGIPEPVDLRYALSRNEYGRKWKIRNMNAIKGVVWHQAMANGSIEAVARYHTGPDSHLAAGGVESLAYTFAIRRDGQIVLCNDLEKATWSHGDKTRKGDENAEFIAVMFEGLFSSENQIDLDAGEPTIEQIISGISLWKVIKAFLKLGDNSLFGHSMFGKAACPGATLQAIINANISNCSTAFGNYNDKQLNEDRQIWSEEPSTIIESDTQEYVSVEIEHSAANKAEYVCYDFSTIEARQQALSILGYYRGEIDGIWGPQSSAAFTFFQNSCGVSVDGIWGPESENAINKALCECASMAQNK